MKKQSELQRLRNENEMMRPVVKAAKAFELNYQRHYRNDGTQLMEKTEYNLYRAVRRYKVAIEKIK